jgi:adenylate cyclase
VARQPINSSTVAIEFGCEQENSIMVVHRSISSKLPGEVLSALRKKLRAQLHQIISYTELMAESAASEDSRITDCLSDILSASEAILAATSSYNAADGVGSFIDDFSRHMVDYCSRIRHCSEQIEILVRTERSSDFQTDSSKLRASVTALDDLVSNISIDKVAAVTDASPRPVFPLERTTPYSTNGSSPESKPKKNPAQGGLILVVDDNEANRDVLSRRLLRDGCEVMLAETGRQALRMAQRYNFDLMLLDIMMPEMDGYAVLAELRKDNALRHLPVIMITAVDEIESVVHCIELGADDYLPKPFNPVILHARINALLERKRLRDNEVLRTRELEHALAEVENQKTKAQELLVNILPHSVACELQSEGIVQPMYFEDVTIAFADFVGFTLATEHLPADELVNILNQYFTAFDKIVQRYGLEKLKTIGDCYMFVGGLPARSPSHPVDLILSAFELIQATEELAKAGPVNWKLRIGVHTGPVVAGVVGIHKFAFDIWGESVNFSSRMEIAGAPGRINVSSHTYARIKDFFSCEKRERIKTKDGREVDMYFVNNVPAALLANQKKGFEQRYRTYFRTDLKAFPGFLTQEAAE